MLLATTRFALSLFAAASLTAAFGPPHISVREVLSSTPGGMLAIEATHHNETSNLNVVGRAEGTRDGKRVSLPLRVVRTGEGKYSVARQWQTGSPWLLVLTAEDGPGGAHAVAEAFVKIDATGKVSGIEYPAPGWVEKTNTPKRTAAKDIDAMLMAMRANP